MNETFKENIFNFLPIYENTSAIYPKNFPLLEQFTHP